MYVSFITPTTLSKPVLWQNLRIIFVSLCPVGAWIYFLNNPSWGENILQTISVYFLIVDSPHPYKFSIALQYRPWANRYTIKDTCFLMVREAAQIYQQWDAKNESTPKPNAQMSKISFYNFSVQYVWSGMSYIHFNDIIINVLFGLDPPQSLWKTPHPGINDVHGKIPSPNTTLQQI